MKSPPEALPPIENAKRKRYLQVALCFLLIGFVSTVSPGAETAAPIPVDLVALKKWQDARFGMFIHWGPISQKGLEISSSRGAQLPIEEYDNLYRTFDPVQFNADEWVNVARAAHMKYIVLTCKHHDGFCLWDTRQTDYNIMHTPLKRDVVKELSEACKKQGVPFGCYYSIADWHDPDFPVTKNSTGGTVRREHSDLDKYTGYLKAQLKELLANYGPLFTLWFDAPREFDTNRGQGVIDMARSSQPTIIINSRAGAPGDYETPEQYVGSFDRARPWETCMTIGDQWAWKPNDRIKPLKKCLQALILSAGSDGNFLLNIGPKSNGQMESAQVARLKEMGDWLAQYGESIYGTRGGPYKPKPGHWGAATCKENTIYLHIFTWTGASLVLPPIRYKIFKSELLTGGDVNVKQDDQGVTIFVAPSDRKEIDTLVKLQLNGPAMDIPPISQSTVP